MKTQSSAKPFGFIRLSVALLTAMVFGVLGTTSASAAPLTINVVGVDANGVDTALPSNAELPMDRGRGRHQGIHPRPASRRQPTCRSACTRATCRSWLPGACRRKCRRTRGSRRHSALQPDACQPQSRSQQALLRFGRGGRLPDGRCAGCLQQRRRDGDGLRSTSIRCRRHRSPSKSSTTTTRSTARRTSAVEAGLAGFTVKLIEAGGTYGMSGGEVSRMRFGNPLGTTYDANGRRGPARQGHHPHRRQRRGHDQEPVPGQVHDHRRSPRTVPTGTRPRRSKARAGSTRGSRTTSRSFFQEFGPPGAPRVRRLHEVRLYPGKQPKRRALPWPQRRCRASTDHGPRDRHPQLPPAGATRSSTVPR